jgi:hypothetical protein
MADNYICTISHLAGSCRGRAVPGSTLGLIKGHPEFIRHSARTPGYHHFCLLLSPQELAVRDNRMSLEFIKPL